MKKQRILSILFVMAGLAGCSSVPDSPPSTPFEFVYSPENAPVINPPGSAVAAITPEAAAQLSPAAGGNMGTMNIASHENDPGASELRDAQTRRAILNNSYGSVGVPFVPSDY